MNSLVIEKTQKEQNDAEIDAQMQPALDDLLVTMLREFDKGADGRAIECDLGVANASEMMVEELLTVIPGTALRRFVERVRAADSRNIVTCRKRGLRISRDEIEARLDREAVVEGKQQYEQVKAHIEGGLSVHMNVPGCSAWPSMADIKRTVRHLGEFIRLCQQNHSGWMCEPYSHGLLIGEETIVNKALRERYRTHRGNHFIHFLQAAQPPADGKLIDASAVLQRSVLSTPLIEHVSMSLLHANEVVVLRDLQRRLDAGEKLSVVAENVSPDVDDLLNSHPHGRVYRVLRCDADNEIHPTTHGFLLTSKKAAETMRRHDAHERVAQQRAALFGNLFGGN